MSDNQTTQHFAGLALRNDFADKEPRIRDLDLGERLGYSEPRMIRRVIAGLYEQGHLPGAFCAAPAQNKKGRPSNEFWLDERSALLVASQSGMAKGLDVTKEVIELFVRYRRGELPSLESAAKATHLLLSENPCDWDPMFEQMVVNGFCAIHGKPMPLGGSHPLWLASSYAKLYRMILGKAEYAELKLRNGEPRFGSNHHQFLKPGPRDRFRRELKTVIGFLRASLATPNPKRHFWDLMSFHYENQGSIQMWMAVV